MKYILCSLLLFNIAFVQAQTDTLYTMDKKLISSFLKEGTSQYMVFLQNKLKPKFTDTQLWTRTIKYKKVNGVNAIAVEQKWYGSDSVRYRYIYSLVDRNTFLPIHHRTWTQQAGTEAYDFYTDKVVGSDTVINNTKKSFTLKFTKPTMNWELDLETFGLLPLKAGKSFAISFYHPGGKEEPKLYRYEIIGASVLTSNDGTQVMCWKLKIDYGKNGSAFFYISKKGNEVVRMEEEFGPIKRYKIKQPSAIDID